MRGAMDGDVAAERQLNVIERLLVRMPRDRGFRVHTDGSVRVSVYPAPSRARLPAEKQKGSPRLSKRAPRSEEAGSKRAANARTRRSAARAAKRAERREQAEARLQQAAPLPRWLRCSAGGALRKIGPLGCEPGRPPPPPPA